jgi:hypothetical protein
MERKENTPERERKRIYEEKHKTERKAKCKIWGTSLDRVYADEIDEFLSKYHITKVALIAAGFEALKEQIEKTKIE